MSLLDQLFVYHPHPWEDRDWARASGLPLEDVGFASADGTKLFGWYVESTAASAVLLWCHGNAGNIIPARGAAAGGEAATIEFAVALLGVKDIIVCGHFHCGEMQAIGKSSTDPPR